MSLDIDFSYEKLIFAPPAPAINVELRSPAFPLNHYAERILALIDTGADGTVIPWSSIERLNLQQVDQAEVKGYDQKDFSLLPVFSVHLTIPGLDSLIVRVVPKESDDYAIIGRDVINKWLLKLNGPALSGSIGIQ